MTSDLAASTRARNPPAKGARAAALEARVRRAELLVDLWETLSTVTDTSSAVVLANRRLHRRPEVGIVVDAVVPDAVVPDAVGPDAVGPDAAGPEGVGPEAVTGSLRGEPEEPAANRVRVPIVRDGQAIGHLLVTVAGPAAPHAPDQPLLDGLAAAFGAVIARSETTRLAATAAEISIPAWADASARLTRVAGRLTGALAQAQTPRSRADLTSLLDELAAAHRAIRRAEGGAHLSRPRPAGTRGLASLLRQVAVDFGAATGIGVTMQLRGVPYPLDATVEDRLRSFAVEGLLNAELDARASTVSILLAFLPAEVTLTLRDDGTALVHRTGFGVPWAIRSMQLGIERAGGRFRAANVLPRGAEVVASFDAGRDA